MGCNQSVLFPTGVSQHITHQHTDYHEHLSSFSLQHHALRAAITTLERYKEMSAKRREDRYMIHEWEARAKRRFAEYNVEADKAKVVEENLLRCVLFTYRSMSVG